MSAIALMIEEHRYIKRILKLIRKLCVKIFNKEAIDYDDFYKIIDFVRNYADKHHHNKEEDILFKKMSEELGPEVSNGPIWGMLAEHNLGRLYISNLEKALNQVKTGDEESKIDIIANAISYVNLLNGHIDKEDNAIYQYGQNNLSQETMNLVEKMCQETEDIASNKNIQKYYTELVESLESKY